MITFRHQCFRQNVRIDELNKDDNRSNITGKITKFDIIIGYKRYENLDRPAKNHSIQLGFSTFFSFYAFCDTTFEDHWNVEGNKLP